MEGNLTIQTALKGHQLSAYRVENKAELQLIIATLLLDLAKSFSLSEDKTLTVKDANALAIYIIQERWQLKLAEIYLFIENAKNGKYGKVYHGLSRAVIMEWLNIYEQETCAVLESERASKVEDFSDLKLAIEKKPEVFETLKLIGSEKPKSEAKEIEMDAEIRDEKNRIMSLSKLQYSFPKQMREILALVHERYKRFGKVTTTSELMNNRKIQRLQKILTEQFTNVNR